MRHPHRGQGQQAHQNGETRDRKRHDIQRGGDGKGALENRERQGLDPRLVNGLARTDLRGFGQTGDEISRITRHAQAELARLNAGKLQRKGIQRQHDLPDGVAIIAIDARDRQGQRANLDRIAQGKPCTPRQLFVNHHRLPREGRIPCGRRALQEPPVVAVGGMVAGAEHLGRLACDLHIGRLDRQDGRPRTFGKGHQCGGLLGAIGADVQLGCQPLVQKAGKGQPETRHHRGHTDIGRDRQHQGHQRQRQTRQLLAGIGPEPLRSHTARLPAGKGQHAIQHRRQGKGGPDQQSPEQGKAHDKTIRIEG